MRVVFVILIFNLLILSPVQAQKAQVVQEASKILVEGTSTLHDWTIEAEQMLGEATFKTENEQLLVSSLNFKVPVKGLKSGKGAMDANTHKALEAKKHPAIVYQLTQISAVSKVDNGYELTTKGKLTIAGTSCAVSMKVKATTTPKGLRFTGTLPLKMTDYKIDPPTALMGTIKTGNDIKVDFSVTYN